MPSLVSSRIRAVVSGAVLVAASLAGLWAELWGTRHLGWREWYSSSLASLFAMGVVLAFGAAAVPRPAWRRVLQGAAAVCLGGMLLPINLASLLPPPKYTYRREERLVTVRAMPTFERGEYGINYLVLPAPEPSSTEIRILFGPPGSRLPNDHPLTFTVWRTREVLLPNWRVKGEVPPWYDNIETIRDGNKTLYDVRICPVHHVMMQPMELPIHYGGLVSYDPASAEFSGGPGYIDGGDLPHGLTAMGYRCPVCAELYQAWLAKHKAHGGRR